ncbi:MerR family transcriptional regulator [Tessaracoccus caeni]|uniref:MerR family transcriptional regulator n=1 Tax=Tessaracoccus caeni TaxID=3031239 RepID=UPI0023D9E582|nr:MerR family transcriptional regulator [Tessaracoccus caeni]MDF1488884.1 MerR family transcriptional regulator [Tessaracoccus caeni]
MERSIGDVARMTGVTTRTLRHYDDIGLLRPVRVSANGYRWYGREELLRLQRILLLRELRLPLPEIQALLDNGTDEAAFLRQHRERLQAERARLDQVLETVGRTIDDLEGASELEDEEFFVGLRRRTEELRADLSERFGPEVDVHFDVAEASLAGWTREDHERAAERGRDLHGRLAAARTVGLMPDDDEVLDLMAEHYEGVLEFWPATPAGYYALAEATTDSPQQRALLTDVDPDLPDWLAESIRAYAVRRLGYQP